MRVIESLETARVGNPALSEAVLRAIGWDWECMGCPGGGMWRRPDEGLHCGALPAVTESAEAARALVPDGFQVVAKAGPGEAWEVCLHRDAPGSAAAEGDLVAIAVGTTLALALCGAAVKLALT